MAPEFPLSLFEQAVVDLDCCWGIEPSCKVEGNRLFAGRFNASMVNWPRSIEQSLNFLDAVKCRVGISVDRELLDKFLAVHINSHKIIGSVFGIDLRPNIKDSSLKVHIRLAEDQDCDELVMTAIALDQGSYSPEVIQVLLKDCYMIGFDFFLNGYSVLEFYTNCAGKKNLSILGKKGQYLRSYLERNFSPKIISLANQSAIFIIGFSQGNEQPVLYFEFDELKDIKKSFLFNSLGERIYGFCQNNEPSGFFGIGVTEKALEKNKLEEFRFYYRKKCD
ncbi:LynF/TruF/PatF family peptide O-prenyltransferase [Symplocastrum sp. BBK-W-15]|uniref:LynF/TruF/PatF family peptide O-prenyltransferase n=1 Tax=Limnofasciculus baicalensis BBK-W-15 TaxID=2699891 RepID=A0AAE3KMH0_9CYAN|nr:LynF/TruF/PatF family peptide O-prenyltransferase [Limnofasciculus baicalensis BBK-W-15]